MLSDQELLEAKRGAYEAMPRALKIAALARGALRSEPWAILWVMMSAAALLAGSWIGENAIGSMSVASGAWLLCALASWGMEFGSVSNAMMVGAMLNLNAKGLFRTEMRWIGSRSGSWWASSVAALAVSLGVSALSPGVSIEKMIKPYESFESFRDQGEISPKARQGWGEQARKDWAVYQKASPSAQKSMLEAQKKEARDAWWISWISVLWVLWVLRAGCFEVAMRWDAKKIWEGIQRWDARRMRQLSKSGLKRAAVIAQGAKEKLRELGKSSLQKGIGGDQGFAREEGKLLEQHSKAANGGHDGSKRRRL